MGLRHDLMELAREQRRDPRGLYQRQLRALLDLHETAGHMTKQEVLDLVTEWSRGQLQAGPFSTTVTP